MSKNCKHCGIDLNETKGIGLQCYTCKNGLLRYGMNRLDMIKMLEEQNGQCKLCHKDVELFTRRSASSAYIDHCHKTGRVRGILCHPCNTSLGYIETNLDLALVEEYILPE